MRYEQKAEIQDNNKAKIYENKMLKLNKVLSNKDKLKEILAICEANKKVDWVSADADMKVFWEFDVIIKLLKEVINE